ncbi:MAG: MFS transporter [Acidobacteriota bacterium]
MTPSAGIQTSEHRPPPADSRYKWAVVAMLWFVCFFNYADRQAIFSVFPLLKVELQLSDVQLGIVGAAFMWVYAAAAPMAGLAGDRFKRKTLIIGGLVFWSLITIATALSTRYWHLVVFRALEGLGEAFYFPASMALVSDYHGPETRSRAMSIHQSSVYAGTIAGGTAAGFLGQHYGWRSSFLLFGGLGVILGVALLALLREPARGQAESAGGLAPETQPLSGWQSIRSLLANPMVRVLTAVFVGANFVAMVFLTWMPSYFYNHFGLSLSMAGLNGTAYLQIASVLGVIAGGVLADRMARRQKGGRMMTQAIGLIAGVPFIFIAGWTLAVPVLLMALVGFGFFKGMYDANIWASLHDVVPPERRAAAVGLMNSVGWLGGGIAPVAIAAASERYGMSACLSSTSAIYLVTGLFLALAVRRYARSPGIRQPIESRTN